MCSGGPPPGGTYASIAKYAPPLSSPVTRKRYVSPGPRNVGPAPTGRCSSSPCDCVRVAEVTPSPRVEVGCASNERHDPGPARRRRWGLPADRRAAGRTSPSAGGGGREPLAERLARGHVELAEDLGEVALDRARGDEERLRDLAVREPLGGQLRDAQLAGRERVHAREDGEIGRA